MITPMYLHCRMSDLSVSVEDRELREKEHVWTLTSQMIVFQ